MTEVNRKHFYPKYLFLSQRSHCICSRWEHSLSFVNVCETFTKMFKNSNPRKEKVICISTLDNCNFTLCKIHAYIELIFCCWRPLSRQVNSVLYFLFCIVRLSGSDLTIQNILWVSMPETHSIICYKCPSLT